MKMSPISPITDGQHNAVLKTTITGKTNNIERKLLSLN